MEKDKTQTNDYANNHGSLGEQENVTLEQAIQNLTQCVKSSEAYHSYLEAKQVIFADQEKFKRVSHYRKRNYEFQNSNIQDPLGEAQRIAEEHTELTKDPEIEKYLDAELELCRMVQQVNYDLIKELEFELGF
jgi:cell fate (sporulation/competence/biofilm development) regulator YlbF (YheA/YmcA/DUF963 family)